MSRYIETLASFRMGLPTNHTTLLLGVDRRTCMEQSIQTTKDHLSIPALIYYTLLNSSQSPRTRALTNTWLLEDFG